MTPLHNMKILVAELMDDTAIEYMKHHCQVDVKYKLSRSDLLALIPEYHAIVVRSETLIDTEFFNYARNMKIVGRGGSGLDNIDIPCATQRGVIVANTPESNIVSAAEHTIALMLASARNVAWADRFLKEGNWDRKRFLGSEIMGKTIGIIGFGRIGGLIAERLKGFQPSKIIVYDPYIADARFKKYEVEKKESIEDLLKESDIITIHTPLTHETKNMISHSNLSHLKPGVRLVNVARGGLFNESAVAEGIRSGLIASAAIDVWMNEPQESHELYTFDSVIATPHLGASTFEAQERVGIEVAHEVISGLQGELVKNAVNIPSVSESVFKKLHGFIDLAVKMGALYSQIRRGVVEKVELTFYGSEIENEKDVKLLSLMALKGILEKVVPETVNFVNAYHLADQRGIEVHESLKPASGAYSNMVTLTVFEKKSEPFSISGTVLDASYPRIVKIDSADLDLIPEGIQLYIPHKNVPGVIGTVGVQLGKNGVNISRMVVSNTTSDISSMFLTIDTMISEEILHSLKASDTIIDVSMVTF